MGEPFLQLLCDIDGWDGATWEDWMRFNNLDDVEIRERKGKLFLGGRWGELQEEAVKAEMRGVENACGDVISFLWNFCDEGEVRNAAERTERKTRKWLLEGKERNLPVWEPESDWSDYSDY